jgi:hypothetical protein
MEFLVVHTLPDDHEVVLNRGIADGVRQGQRFLIYHLGDEIIDPSTRESLGRLELVAGTGTVTHVQERMCTVRSDMTGKSQKRISQFRNSIMRMAGDKITEEIMPAEPVPFKDPKVGDLARPI